VSFDTTKQNKAYFVFSYLADFRKQKQKTEISRQQRREDQPIGKSVIESHFQFTL
jgi:hypothetical protein